ncbi:spore germination protein [Vallitalea maricola]|uniref:Spore germination protein n=1 Tax=Vallitalea maricola TaxID=3074433 RepID=A0ACB5UJA5_9FIRM|nr:spore germination protein [Vallitalea sp. AN17-2]
MLSNNINENIAKLKNIYKNDAFVQYREFEAKYSSVKYCLISISGMIDNEELTINVVRQLLISRYPKNIVSDKLLEFVSKKVLTSIDLTTVSNINDIISNISFGYSLLLVDTCDKAILINSKGFEKRAIEEPDAERVTKGPKEGFNESLVTNTSLVRKKIKNPNLKFEIMVLGNVTKTRICISYMEDTVSQKILKEVKKRLNDIDVDIILESEYICEYIQDRSISFFNTIGNSERPDVIAAKLLEGKIAIFTDGSPSVLTVPYLFIEQFEVNEDYYSHYFIASFNRVLRIFCFILSTSIPALYIALITYHHEMIPQEIMVSIVSSREGVPFPSIVELILMLITFEILREAGSRLPQNIGQTISIVGALVLGEAAVSARLISAPIVIITALTGITSLALPFILESVIFIKFYLLIFCSFFGLYGYIFGVMSITIHLMNLKSFGVDYMTFFTDLNKLNVQDTAIRIPWWNINNGSKNLINYRIKRLEKKRLKSNEKN